MPMCGFNEKMLNGLTAFNEGLVEHGIKFRSEKDHETTDQAIKREISDMTRFLLEVNKIENSAKRKITEGLLNYSMGIYLLIRKVGVENYKKIIKEISEYFKLMDFKFYNELEDKPNDMIELVDFLNELK
ncbi:MAG: hypothetical protein Q8N88_02230 [Nanoarchaeota archaeon]|nr:hypothetical protein [Nanoarchaeota archaeon]